MYGGQGNIFRSVCQEFCPQGAGSVHGGGGHAWWGACMAGRGACVTGVGVCMVEGMHGRGACMVGGMHGRGAGMHGGAGVHSRYYEIWSMSGQYASYWNAFSFLLFMHLTRSLFTLCRDPITLRVQNYPYWWHHDVQEMSVTIKKERKVVLWNVLFLYGIRQDQNVINLVYSYWLPWEVPILLVKLKKSCSFQRNVEFGWQFM